MCGIIGHISKNKLFSNDLYSRMLKRIKHRGPDAEGIYTCNKNKIAFGHVRLSIIDTKSESDQPMGIGGKQIIFNGEIYNYKELKTKYLKNEDFNTSSDTEVILKLYIKYGIKKTINILRGMFAFAIYDNAKNKVYIVRDQVGKKPLYYYKSDNELFFTSEVKALKEIDSIKFIIDDNEINNCLYYRYSERSSPFNNIEMLKNGNYIEYNLSNHNYQILEYFKFSDLINEDLYKKNEKMNLSEIIENFESLLISSIRKRLISDVPIASINSGGIDSSLISAIAFQIGKLKMFHVDVNGFSERPYAELLAKDLNQELNVKEVNSKEFEENIDNIIYHYEYPLVHPNSFGISQVSKLANSHKIKVLLGGEGADELFGGYKFQIKYYYSLKIRNKLSKIIERFCKKFVSLFETNFESKAYNKIIFSNTKKQLIKNSINNKKYYSFLKNENEIEMSTYMLNILDEYLQPILLRADKMGMKHSVEIRSPFLDLDIIEFALNLPLKYKFKLFKGKIIVKKMSEKYLNPKIIYRKKVGFPMPFSNKFTIDNQESSDRNFILYSKNVLKKYFNNKNV